MRRLRPGSILQLILLGFLAALLPLVAAVVIAVVRVDRLAEGSREEILRAQGATQHSRVLVEQVTAMQRAVGQYLVLGDTDFYATFLAQRAVFRDAAASLAGIPTAARLRLALERLVDQEERLFQSLPDPETPRGALPEPAAFAAEWAALGESARSALAESSRLIGDQANRSLEAAAGLQRLLLLIGALVIPISGLLALFFASLILRPLRQMDQAVRGLGNREFDAPISVTGPADLEELGRRLEWLRRRIVELENQKMDFLRQISHELKTPLTTVREGAELLLADPDQSLSAEHREIAQILSDSGQDLQKLIEDLLQYNRIQSLGTIMRQRVPVDLGEAVVASLQSHALACAAKGLTVETELQQVTVPGDPKLLGTVVDNLVSNAIKYSEAGGPIHVSLAVMDGLACLDVRDRGPGVDPGDREKVFEAFYQGKAVPTGPVKGTGLGLSIVRQYVAAHRGRVEFMDTPAGAHVRVELPLDED